MGVDFMSKDCKVLITGGAGFIGTHLSRALIKDGFSIVILDSLSVQIHGEGAVYSGPLGVEFIRGDIRDKETVRRSLKGIDVVFHLAAETGTGQSMYEIERYVSVNDVGTANLLECIGDRENTVTDVILASSRSIYGEGAYLGVDGNVYQPSPRSNERLSKGYFEHSEFDGVDIKVMATPESLPHSLSSIYAATKYSQEILCDVASRSLGFRLSILRFQNVFGEGQSLNNPYTGIISIFYNRIRQGLPIRVYEDGLESRDFVHIDDVVWALIASYRRESVDRLLVNIGSGVATSVLGLANSLLSVSGFSSDIIVSGEYRVGDIRHCYADLDNARQTLGFNPSVSLDKGLSRFCNWAKQMPESVDRSEKALVELKEKGLAK